MLESVQFVVKKACMLTADRPILVGVSGGPDSRCLLDVLWRSGYPLVVAHLNHNLRPESEGESQILRIAVQEMGLPFVLGQADVHALADSQALSIEEAARSARYRFLFQQAECFQAQAVAVGHTADDQVETVLMHLLRGAGLAGLRGMEYRNLPNAWSQQMPLVRPLLGVWRAEIMAYLEARGIQPVLDASNLDTRFYRNRLRHELLPYLESYNPQVRQRLWRMAEVLQQDYAILQEQIEAAWRASLHVQGVGSVAFNAPVVLAQPAGIQRHLIRRAIGLLRPGLRDIDFAAVERALGFLAHPSRSAQIDLAAGLRLLYEADLLWLAGWESDLPGSGWPQISEGEQFDLEIPGGMALQNGWSLYVEIAADPQAGRAQALSNTDPFQMWCDLDCLRLPLQVCARHPGDRFQPLGMEGHSLKLSDYLINARLPRRARQNWPLVLSGKEIAWVPGLGLGHPFRVTETTRRLAHLGVICPKETP